MLVGEGPGETEDNTGRPFVGRAGKLLDSMLASVGIERGEVYITNIVKCRPPRNRDPDFFEQNNCLPWLREQTRLISPKIIVCLGRVAAMRLIRSDFHISAEHGRIERKGAFNMMAIYHPSYLLRSPQMRPETFADLKVLERFLNENRPAGAG
jgi:DNA polymerase